MMMCGLKLGKERKEGSKKAAAGALANQISLNYRPRPAGFVLMEAGLSVLRGTAIAA
jgi:hypothetical protein